MGHPNTKRAYNMKTTAHLQTDQPSHRTAAEPNRPFQEAKVSVFVDNRSEAVAQRRLAEAIHKSPDMVAQRQQLRGMFGEAAQLMGGPEEEELVQGKFAVAQRQGGPEEEELLQGKFAAMQRQGGPEEEELLQGKFKPVQRVEDKDEEPVQGKCEAVSSLQMKEESAQPNASTQLSTGNTGLPDHLKSGIESLSGISMDNVKVHYNSSQPAQLNALAYTQGTDIHVAPGQEQHLPHEAWHVVQQAQGRVQPTMQLKDGVPVNDDEGLEHEADVMGARGLQSTPYPSYLPQWQVQAKTLRPTFASAAIQRQTNLLVQQGPSCWLYVLEAVAKAKGIGTNYITMVMKSYPDSPEAVAKQKDEEASGREISKRAAALELIADNMTEMIAKLHNWKIGYGGQHAGGRIKKVIVERYARQTLGTDRSVEHLTFSAVDETTDVAGIMGEYNKAKKRATKLAANTIKEEDDVASLLNTGYQTIDEGQAPSDVDLALANQNTPCYASIRMRFNVRPTDQGNGAGQVIDFTRRPISEMQPTAHAILLDSYDKGSKTAIYKDPNYGNVKIQVTHIQFQKMAGHGDEVIKLRPFFKDGASKSKLAEVQD